MAKSRSVPSCQYIKCGAVLNAVSMPKHGTAPMPQPGDYTVCLNCEQIMVFTDDLLFRAPTEEELHEAFADPDIYQVLCFTHAYHEWIRKQRKH